MDSQYIVAQYLSYNNNPVVKNCSNCDILGSFYTVEEKKAVAIPATALSGEPKRN
jgi:hypothetical protein